MFAAYRLAVSVLLLVWLNAYICRDLFSSSFTGFTNSMQGFWAGLARLAGPEHWFLPRWWPYHDAGSPFEWTYAPVVPALAALWSFLGSVSPLRGVQAVSGLVFCLGPVTLFLFCAVATRRWTWSFATAAVYSLIAPTEWLVPDAALRSAGLWDARRFSLIASWDETPHYGALALLPVALLFAFQAMRTGRWRYWFACAAAMALSLMTSAFGATTLALGMLCLLLAMRRWANVPWVLGSAGVAWALASPSLPPSLLATIRENAKLHDPWTAGSFTAVAAIVAGGLVILVLCDRCRTGWWARFVLLFAWATAMIPVLFQYLDRWFVPQPGRYKVEAEMGLVLAFMLGAQWLLDRTPKRVQAAVALVAVALAAEQTIRLRQFEKRMILEKDPAQTLEYQVAAKASATLAGKRIALPGSLAQWYNAFADGQQFSGSSYSTAYNPVQQMVWNRWLSATTPAEAADALVWLRAFGTYAFAAPSSGEFWKAMNHPELYVPCEVRWEESGMPMCQVPGSTGSIAHVVRPEALVTNKPRHAADLAEVRRYTAALDRPAEFTWNGSSQATIRATVRRGELVAVQNSWHPGWSAVANGGPANVRADGLGLSVVEPSCDGLCEIRLTYGGGAELIACHALRWGCVIFLALVTRRRLSRHPVRGIVADKHSR